MKKIYYVFLDILYKMIRPLFVKNIDPNEDFYCVYCNKPVLERYIFCSKECSELLEFNEILPYTNEEIIERMEEAEKNYISLPLIKKKE